MRVTRVQVCAPIAAFRYPFFVTGRQPTFDMPPPSTVYGHCAGALGRFPDPSTFVFGLHFTYISRGSDLEHQHIAVRMGAQAKTMVPTVQGDQRATTEITVQPVIRDFLFGATLTLYLPPELGHAFRCPVHTAVLGRSQDLAEIIAVDDVTLERPSRARLEHTLLPRAVRPSVRFGTTVLLTRYIAEPPGREATFAQYISLHEPVFFGEGAEPNRAFQQVDGMSLDDFWSDPTIVDDEGFARGVWLHRIVE